ncbi:phosphate ABC transporter substrate-binding/OmpA family protein [Roseisalinus antarcticus]|uniref:phosphate ABC transporter substrate-binding/OmpA family protein n=1 Tax=Roseisalinus antarcticus TaxID=254357 RepID=UPI001F1E424B|nr:phosphate ABC transporter substrate-binding/OmpA family protein [Roseisalinus antarcticus]
MTAREGGLTLRGDVLGFDGLYLRLRTDAGEVTLDYAAVTCDGAACPDPATHVPDLRLSGAARMGEVLMPALIEGFAFAEGYAARREEDSAILFSYVISDRATGQDLHRFSFRLTTTDEGFADLLSDAADVALSVRELRPAEREAGLAAGLGDLALAERSRIIALDGLVPIVSAAQDRQDIDIDVLSRAYAGEIDNWSEIGGPDREMTLHLVDETEGHAQGFVDRVVAVGGASLSDRVIHHVDAAALAAAVSADPGALGIVPYRAYGDARPLAMAGACGRSSAATLETLKTEDYPLTMPLFLYLPIRRLPPVAAEFLGWLRTERAQFIVRRAGFVDLGAEPIPVAAQGQRFAGAIEVAGPEITLADLQQMVRVLGRRDRLSTTFRFEVGSTRLDAQSRSNVYQLARAIRDGTYEGQTLLLAGFSDGVGVAAANRALSGARAESVLRELVAALGGSLPPRVRVRTAAFGEALPMGCDDTEWGRQTNRRVELWVDATGAAR